MNSKECVTPGCSRPVMARNMCSACYKRWSRKEHPGRQYRRNKIWREKNPKLRNAQTRRNYQRGAQHATNGGQSYDDFDYQMILDKTIIDNQGRIIKECVCDRELAKFLGRTVRAIQGQRHRLKNYRV